MELHVWCQTDVGLRRETNQDFFLCDEEAGLYVVADGMGGHRGGEVASRMAAETLRDSVHEAVLKTGARRPNPRVILVEGYEQACHKVYDTSQEPTNDLNGMGTTLVAALLHEDTLFIANVGDSRAYLFTNNLLWQITEDHSLMNEQLRAGLITEKDIARYQGRNVITRSVGYERDIQVDIIERKIYPGEIILMCSDGLSGLVSDQRIAEICRTHKPAEIVSICINEAKKNGGDDNVTVMVLYADGQDEVTKV
jgi:PPM family protein phosphatase